MPKVKVNQEFVWSKEKTSVSSIKSGVSLNSETSQTPTSGPAGLRCGTRALSAEELQQDSTLRATVDQKP